jgi:hypothetical protein
MRFQAMGQLHSQLVQAPPRPNQTRGTRGTLYPSAHQRLDSEYTSPSPWF